MSTAQLLEPFLNLKVLVSTHDGKVLTAILTGFDPQCNLVLSKCTERLFSKSHGVDTQQHGLYLVRGDNVATLGEIDPEIDEAVEWDQVAAAPLREIRY